MPYDSTILKCPYYDKMTNFTNLNYGYYNLKYEVYKPKEASKLYVKYHKVFFDVETITVGKHKPYLVCWDDDNNEVGTYYNEKTMLNSPPDHEILC